MVGYEDEVMQYKDILIEEIEKHKFVFDNFRINWSVGLIEETNNEYNLLSKNTEFKLKFEIRKGEQSRVITLTKYDFEFDSENPMTKLKEVVFHWDYTKLYEFFNR